MKILMVSSYLPFPLFSGGHIRLYNILKILSKTHEVTLVCEKRNYQTEKDVSEVEKICKKVITVDRKKQWSFSNILKTAFTLTPFLVVGHISSEMKKIVNEELLKESYDLVHVETFYVMQNLPKVNIPVVLVEHNIEYLVYQRYVKQASFFLRPILNLDIIKLKKAEEKAWSRATKLVAVSSKEKQIMEKDASVVPNGVDIEKFKMRPQKNGKNKTILFIGDFRWIENKDCALFIIRDIWPKFSQAISVNNVDISPRLWIVGKNIPKSIKKRTLDSRITFDENASADTSLIFQNSDILLSPIRVGGGTSFKILEAMASGVCVVTTELGVEGIGAENGENVLVGENAEDFAEKVISILTNKTMMEKISKNARHFVEENYTWDGIVKKLENVYISAVKT